MPARAGGGRMYYIVKLLISALVIVTVSEFSKRSSFAGGLLASLPLVSILAMTWLWVDTRDAAKVSALSGSIFWLVVPSLLMFVALPLLLKRGLAFPWAMGTSILVMLAGYGLMLLALNRFGVKL